MLTGLDYLRTAPAVERPEHRTRLSCPDNEFTEICTGDMATADHAYAAWLDPRYDQDHRRKWLEEHRKPEYRDTRYAITAHKNESGNHPANG